MGGIFFFSLLMWMYGTYVLFTSKDKTDIHSAFKTMWGHRLVAISILVIGMIDAMVNEGDIVVMKREPTWSNGDMVAVWLKDREETTLKYIFREGNQVRLQPANPNMDAIIIENPEIIEVQGKVMLVLRQLA